MFRLISVSVLLMAAVSTADPIADLSAANNRFAVGLLHELAQAESGNLVFSPISLEAALCMTYAGARGETAQQMADALQIDTLGKDVHAAQQDLSSNLRITCNSDTVAQLSIANALWNATCTAKADFTKLLRERYGAEVRQLPGDSKAAADAINAWADLHTEHRIHEVASPQDFENPTPVVLTNAVYFLGRWQFPFEAAHTTARDFWTSKSESLRVPTMQREAPSGQYRYAETDAYQAIELPYIESTAVMDIFLPRERDGLKSFEADLRADSLDRQIRAMAPSAAAIQLELPKVFTEGKWELDSTLANLGMPLALSIGADFSGMCPGAWIGKVVHATFLQIDERGTEAAAVTAVMMETSARLSPPILFRCDHPFFFVIRDTATNTVLFMGHIVNPRD